MTELTIAAIIGAIVSLIESVYIRFRIKRLERKLDELEKLCPSKNEAVITITGEGGTLNGKYALIMLRAGLGGTPNAKEKGNLRENYRVPV